MKSFGETIIVLEGDVYGFDEHKELDSLLCQCEVEMRER